MYTPLYAPENVIRCGERSLGNVVPCDGGVTVGADNKTRVMSLSDVGILRRLWIEAETLALTAGDLVVTYDAWQWVNILMPCIALVG